MIFHTTVPRNLLIPVVKFSIGQDIYMNITECQIGLSIRILLSPTETSWLLLNCANFPNLKHQRYIFSRNRSGG